MLNQQKIASFTFKYNIKWTFEPPSAPLMGGSWERLIQIVQTFMFKIMKGRVLTHLQMTTLFT